MPIFGQIRMKTANFTPDLGIKTKFAVRMRLDSPENGD